MMKILVPSFIQFCDFSFTKGSGGTPLNAHQRGDTHWPGPLGGLAVLSDTTETMQVCLLGAEGTLGAFGMGATSTNYRPIAIFFLSPSGYKRRVELIRKGVNYFLDKSSSGFISCKSCSS